MADQDTSVQAFVGLPIEDLICNPIIGAAKAQKELAKVTLDFVEELAFLPPKDDAKPGDTREANIVNVALDRLTNSSTTGAVAHVNQQIQMPMITLVNTPNFAMDTMAVDFTMEVKQHQQDTSKSHSDTTTTKGAEVKASGSWGWGSASVKANYSTTGNVSADKEQTRSSDFSAKYHVNATAKQLPPAEGMARFTQILASVIEPINTSSAAGEASL